MNRTDIIFDNLLGFLQSLNDEPSIEAFVGTLNSADEERFVEISEQLSTIITNLTLAKENQVFPADYPNILAIIAILESDFPLYQILNLNEIRFITIISNLLANESFNLTDPNPVNYTVNFDIGRALELDSTIIPFFHFYNSSHFDESIFVIDFSNPSGFHDYITQNTIPESLYLVLLSKLAAGSINEKRKYILAKNGSFASMPSTIAGVLMHYVSAGLPFHSPKNYTSATSNPWRDNISISNKYQQFNNVLYVLSEYSHNKEILSKYLLIYHVIEEFMYKSLLVKMESINNGRMFSMRDFSTMNKKIAESELVALKDFLADVNALPYAGGFVADLIYSKWSTFVSGLNPSQTSDVESVMNALAVSKNGFTISAVNNVAKLKEVLPKMVYMIRNAIVHNKATEFHLTYISLSDAMYKLINEFMMPFLEEAIFYITTNPNTSLVWFIHSELALWDNN
ncbi:hypothetical protein GCM10028824_43580 [Hymenobacter segetis]|uniref:Apea-like HEPN domain-containing protein n=1 Tax=Hymenobacter segetis TaxID=2025509 RepID=A0ABU9LU13_9BACT